MEHSNNASKGSLDVKSVKKMDLDAQRANQGINKHLTAKLVNHARFGAQTYVWHAMQTQDAGTAKKGTGILLPLVLKLTGE